MSIVYQINNVKLSNGKRISTNINSIISESNGYLKIEKTDKSKDDYFPLKTSDGNYGWVCLDEEKNITDVERFGMNNINGILSVIESFMTKQINGNTLDFYKKHQINIFENLIISEYELGEFENTILNKGKEVWNCINTIDYDKKMKCEVEGWIWDDLQYFIEKQFSLEQLKKLSHKDLLNQYFNNSEGWVKDCKEQFLSNESLDELMNLKIEIENYKSKKVVELV